MTWGYRPPFFNNPLSPFLGNNVITPCLLDVGSLSVFIECKI